MSSRSVLEIGHPTLTSGCEAVPVHDRKMVLERFEAARKAAGITSDESLAAHVGCSRSQIAKWKSGKGNPRADHAVALCEALHCTLAYLYGATPTALRLQLADQAALELGTPEGEIIAALGQATEREREAIARLVQVQVEQLDANRHRAVVVPTTKSMTPEEHQRFREKMMSTFKAVEPTPAWTAQDPDLQVPATTPPPSKPAPASPQKPAPKARGFKAPDRR